MRMQTINLHLTMPVSYDLTREPASDRGLLVLHGFRDKALAARRRLIGEAPLPGYTVLAPNGFLPMPLAPHEGNQGPYREAYAWYVRDPQTGRVMLPPEWAAVSLAWLITNLGLAHLRWTVVGFSQGGYLAPYLARTGLQVDTLVGVATGYRVEAYEGLSPLAVYGFHGTDDEVIPIIRAREGFEAIGRLGFGRAWHERSGVAHTLDEAGRQALRALLSR